MLKGTLPWLDILVAVLRVLLIALGGATADQLLADGRVGEQLAAPLAHASSFKSSAEDPVALLLAQSPLA